MKNIELDFLRYPIGKPVLPKDITSQHLTEWIDVLEDTPENLRRLVSKLSEIQLDTPYRPQGWTVRQVVHHMADSHHNSYIRFKWGLTEDSPIIKAYNEKAWANLFDTKTAPIELSLAHLSAVHAKLVYLLKGLTSEDLKRTFEHPESGDVTRLDENVGRYAWHSQHHLAHIENLLKRNSWL